MTEVYFKKPNFNKLANESRTIMDMHYHTKYSADSIASPSLIVKKAKKLGIGVAVTDHNTIKGAQEMWKYRKDIRIIPGIEITDATCLHSIVYFYNLSDLEEFYKKEIKPNLYKMPFFISRNLNYVLETSRDYNCVLCMPHPFSPGTTNIKNIKWDKSMLDSIDLIEAINSFNLRARNIQAVDFANELNTGMTGGSDGHSIGELGNAVTIAQGDSNEEFLRSLVRKDSTVIGKESNILKKAVLLLGKETTALKNNIKSKNQLNRMRSQLYISKENIKSHIINRNRKISRLLHRNKKI